MSDLRLSRLKELMAQLDEVCQQARELQQKVREVLAASRRQDRLNLSGQPERRKFRRER